MRRGTSTTRVHALAMLLLSSLATGCTSLLDYDPMDDARTYRGPVGQCRVQEFLYEDSYPHCNLNGSIPRVKSEALLAVLEIAHEKRLIVEALLVPCPYRSGYLQDCEVASVSLDGSIYTPPPPPSPVPANRIVARPDAPFQTCHAYIPAAAREDRGINWTAYFDALNLTGATAYVVSFDDSTCGFVIIHDHGSCRVRHDDTCQSTEGST